MDNNNNNNSLSTGSVEHTTSASGEATNKESVNPFTAPAGSNPFGASLGTPESSTNTFSNVFGSSTGFSTSAPATTAPQSFGFGAAAATTTTTMNPFAATSSTQQQQQQQEDKKVGKGQEEEETVEHASTALVDDDDEDSLMEDDDPPSMAETPPAVVTTTPPFAAADPMGTSAAIHNEQMVEHNNSPELSKKEAQQAPQINERTNEGEQHSTLQQEQQQQQQQQRQTAAVQPASETSVEASIADDIGQRHEQHNEGGNSGTGTRVSELETTVAEQERAIAVLKDQLEAANRERDVAELHLKQQMEDRNGVPAYRRRLQHVYEIIQSEVDRRGHSGGGLMGDGHRVVATGADGTMTSSGEEALRAAEAAAAQQADANIQLSQRLAAMREQYVAAEQRATAAETDLKTFRTNSDGALARVEELEQSIAELREEKSRQLQVMEETMRKGIVEGGASNNEVTELKQRLVVLLRERDVLQRNILRLEEEATERQTESSRVVDVLNAELVARRDLFLTELDALTKQFADEREGRRQAVADATRAAERVASLEGTVRTLEAAVDEFRSMGMQGTGAVQGTNLQNSHGMLLGAGGSVCTPTSAGRPSLAVAMGGTAQGVERTRKRTRDGDNSGRDDDEDGGSGDADGGAAAVQRDASAFNELRGTGISRREAVRFWFEGHDHIADLERTVEQRSQELETARDEKQEQEALVAELKDGRAKLVATVSKLTRELEGAVEEARRQRCLVADVQMQLDVVNRHYREFVAVNSSGASAETIERYFAGLANAAEMSSVVGAVGSDAGTGGPLNTVREELRREREELDRARSELKSVRTRIAQLNDVENHKKARLSSINRTLALKMVGAGDRSCVVQQGGPGAAGPASASSTPSATFSFHSTPFNVQGGGTAVAQPATQRDAAQSAVLPSSHQSSDAAIRAMLDIVSAVSAEEGEAVAEARRQSVTATSAAEKSQESLASLQAEMTRKTDDNKLLLLQLKAEKKSNEEERAALLAQYTSATAELQSCRTQLAESKRNVDSAEARYAAANEQVALVANCIQTQQRIVEALAAQLQSAREEARQIIDGNLTLVQEARALRRAKEAVRSNEELLQALNTLSTKLQDAAEANVDHQLEASSTAVSGLLTLMQQAREEVGAVHSQYEKIVGDVGGVVQDLRKDKTVLEVQVKEGKTWCESVERENADLLGRWKAMSEQRLAAGEVTATDPKGAPAAVFVSEVTRLAAGAQTTVSNPTSTVLDGPLKELMDNLSGDVRNLVAALKTGPAPSQQVPPTATSSGRAIPTQPVVPAAVASNPVSVTVSPALQPTAQQQPNIATTGSKPAPAPHPAASPGSTPAFGAPQPVSSAPVPGVKIETKPAVESQSTIAAESTTDPFTSSASPFGGGSLFSTFGFGDSAGSGAELGETAPEASTESAKDPITIESVKKEEEEDKTASSGGVFDTGSIFGGGFGF